MKIKEMDKLTDHFDKYSEYLYPENGCRQHFLSEKHRSEKF